LYGTFGGCVVSFRTHFATFGFFIVVASSSSVTYGAIIAFIFIANHGEFAGLAVSARGSTLFRVSAWAARGGRGRLLGTAIIAGGAWNACGGTFSRV